MEAKFQIFLILLALLAGTALLARRINVAPAILLLLAGIVLAFVLLAILAVRRAGLSLTDGETDQYYREQVKVARLLGAVGRSSTRYGP